MITGCMGVIDPQLPGAQGVCHGGARPACWGRLAVAVEIFLGHYSWTGLVWSSAFAFLGGFGAGVVSSGVAPLVEIAFATPRTSLC